MFYFPRGGNRGGSDQFKWDDVKTDKHREFYLGHSVKAPVGRWQEGKDLTWYAKDKNDKQSTLKKEFDSVRNAEKEAMMIALGQMPPKTSNNESNTAKQCAYKPQHEHKLNKESSEGKQSSKKKKKKKKKERKERSNNYSSEEEQKRSKVKKYNKHRHYDTPEDESKRKDKKKINYSDHGETERLKHRPIRTEYTQDGKRDSRDVKDRAMKHHKEDNHYRKHHSDGKHKTLKRAMTDSDESSSSEREFKKRKKNKRRK
ncbi:multiple myeloma tumor-associated protein 2 homolog [Anneissia japonica]|uniref:multiple myeloma tumor-associated protein 2 homolog n=1 Tax=Anneissia japonica TaxID=1529436 RepID=UPI00142588A7|nr:multiple myeloma tumor-associated protein 2 homolog [Anneissia japonica]